MHSILSIVDLEETTLRLTQRNRRSGEYAYGDEKKK